jgi:hypothetical protein
MSDIWNEKLRCPQCRKTGMATLSQATTIAPPTVDVVPEGFKIVAGKNGPDFHCSDCDVPAEP